MPNKSFVYQLNDEPSNLVFLKTYNIEFNKTFIVTFTDQNRTPLVIEDKVNLTLITNIQKWYVILQNQEEENMLKDMDFCFLEEIYLIS